MIRISVPATSANIGSGFDSLGLALGLYNNIYMEEYDSIDISSLDGVQIPLDETNLIYTTVKHLYDVCGKTLPGIIIKQQNDIPMTRGLGSSSACVVGGLLGANKLLGSPLSIDEIVNMAAVIEGHPDNSTPAILGGLVTAVLDGDKVYYVKQEIHSHLKFAAFIPDFTLKTEVARANLPTQISHKDAVFNLSRAALMSVSLYSGNFHNLKTAAGDRLHQPYRLDLVNGAKEVFDLSYSLGAYASYISGAGPTIMSMIDENDHYFEMKAIEGLKALNLNGWQLKILSIDNNGTMVY